MLIYSFIYYMTYKINQLNSRENCYVNVLKTSKTLVQFVTLLIKHLPVRKGGQHLSIDNQNSYLTNS
jgi:hypothetical protein